MPSSARAARNCAAIIIANESSNFKSTISAVSTDVQDINFKACNPDTPCRPALRGATAMLGGETLPFAHRWALPPAALRGDRCFAAAGRRGDPGLPPRPATAHGAPAPAGALFTPILNCLASRRRWRHRAARSMSAASPPPILDGLDRNAAYAEALSSSGDAITIGRFPTRLADLSKAQQDARPM